MTRRPGKPWTDEEVGFVIDCARTMTHAEIGEMLGRSARSIEGKLYQVRNGWEPVRERWTAEDDALIRATPNLTANQLAERLPGRTANAINLRRVKLGVDAWKGQHKSPTEVGARRLLAKSCLGCGILLEASWFGFNSSSKSWRTQCLRCNPPPVSVERRTKDERAKQARESSAKLQALSLPTAVKHRQPWTEADHGVLSDPELTQFEKAVRLGRTYHAVKHKCSENGYSSLTGKGDPMKGRWVIDNPNEAALAA